MAKKRKPDHKKDIVRDQFRRAAAVEPKREGLKSNEFEATAPSAEAEGEAQPETMKISEPEVTPKISEVAAVNAAPEVKEISEATTNKETTPGGEEKMADSERESSHDYSETMDRVESAGQSMARTTRGVFENASKMYAAFFSINGARNLAEVYIETNERLAKEALDFGHKFIELSAGGARKFWKVAEEQGREARSGA